ncbi:MAG: UDP-galactopyranose mutase, partial [bacterium P3]
TGPIDEFFNYKLGKLEYRSLLFEHEDLQIDNYQGNTIMNYTDVAVPFTRLVEHKWFDTHNMDAINTSHTVITREFPVKGTVDAEPYYPINDVRNQDLYDSYVKMSKLWTPNILFAGRLGLYKYLDMDETIRIALEMVKKQL